MLKNKQQEKKDSSSKINLPAVLLPIIAILVMVVLFEAAFRVAIFLQVPYFRNPSLYGYPFSDNFWKLEHKWRQQTNGDANGSKENLNPDPFLGWSPSKTSQNPLGLVGHKAYVPDYRAKTILFYGDSFVAGKTAPENNIPRQLDNLVQDSPVYNYGVANYAVDQIYLRFKETHAAFQKPMIIVGIFTLDLDRSLLTVRSSAPKPYFTTGKNGELILNGIQGTPINRQASGWVEQWHKKNPPHIYSYFGAFIAQKIDNIRTNGDWLASTRSQTEIEHLNKLIIEEIVDEAQTHNLPLLFIIFYTRGELDKTYWRELFLIEQFERLDVPYLDTKAVVLRDAKLQSKNLSEYYLADGGHLNELGNRVVAEAIAETLTNNLVVDSGQK